MERDSAYLWTSFSADTKQNKYPVCVQYDKTTFIRYTRNQVPYKVTHTKDTDTSCCTLNIPVTNILPDRTDNTFIEPPTELLNSSNENTRVSTENTSKHMPSFPQSIKCKIYRTVVNLFRHLLPPQAKLAMTMSCRIPLLLHQSQPNSKIMRDSMTSPVFKKDKSHSLEISPAQSLTIEEQKLNIHFVCRQLNDQKTSII